MEYKTGVKTLDDKIFSQMRICSYNLKCDQFKIDFALAKDYESYILYKNNDELSGYFTIPRVQKTVLKIYMPQDSYQKKLSNLIHSLSIKYFTIFIILFLLSILFSLYTLAPLRNALHLTEEFIKDILHDFNTPLSTLRLNTAIIKKRVGKDKNMQRIENSVTNILNLQSNLSSYLQNHSLQKEQFNLQSILNERVSLLNNNLHITIKIWLENSIIVATNRNAFIRIVDNLLTNALKYNKQDGFIDIKCNKNILTIQDSGKGIKNPDKIFDRFYKEQDRGIGIGLHIVKKLCDELNISIKVKSEVGIGSSFLLNLNSLIISK